MDQEPDVPMEVEGDAFPVFGNLEYRFASGVAVYRPQRMVYLEFFQRDPTDEKGVGVGRIVIHPSVLAPLIEQLSAVRHPED
jgi:hypothetical protein